MKRLPLIATACWAILGASTALALEWRAELSLRPGGFKQGDAAFAAVVREIQAAGIHTRLADGRVSMAGSGDALQARTGLFDSLAAWTDFLAGPVEFELSLPRSAQALTLRLEARNTSGYVWEIQADPASAQPGPGPGPSLTPRYRGYGAPSIQTLVLAPSPDGETVVRLRYLRPFERDEAPLSRLTIKLSEPVPSLEISDPTPSPPTHRTEFAAPGAASDEAFREFDATRALPTAWDWRTQSPGIVPAVRDQGGCGSCWSFGTVGVMESALKKGGGPLTDLSEQFLINCNLDGWGCNGGLTANKYHYDTLAASQSLVGAVLESVLPYVEYDQACGTAYPHPYKLSDWRFVTGSEWTVPSTDQIKNVIYSYGPITAGVCVDNGWYSYGGGVYTATANVCSGYTNHQIILVGWNDATQTWILRNSWGLGWGEGGYMHIRYDPAGATSRVGEGTSWVIYGTGASTTASGLAPINALLLKDD